MKALLIGDCHLADRPPSVRTETYAQDILDKMAWCVDYANEHTDVMVLLGDVFHLKSPSRNSHALVQATATVLEKFKGRVLIVPGNHDLSQDRLESLSSQPLGTLALSPNVSLIDGYDVDTGIYGIPYLDDREKFIEAIAQADIYGFESGSKVTLIATHASIFPPGENPPYAHMNADQVAGYEGTIPIAYGHIHDPHGFYQANGVWFCNNGAISRGSLHEETLKRSPKVTVFDSTNDYDCPFTSVDVPHKPAEEVFRLESVVSQKAAEGRLDDFLESVGGVSLTTLSVGEIVAHARTTNLPEAAIQELEEIFEQVQ